MRDTSFSVTTVTVVFAMQRTNPAWVPLRCRFQVGALIFLISMMTAGRNFLTLQFSGWSTHFFDFNEDGWKDLFVAKSPVMDTTEKPFPNWGSLEPPLLL